MPRWMASTPWPSGDGIAGDDVADVGHQVGLGQVAAPVDAGEVEVGLVGAADEVAHRGHGAVGHHLARASSCRSGRGSRACSRSGPRSRPTVAKRKPSFRPGDLAGLDLVQAVVAAHQQQPDRGLDDVAGLVLVVGGQHQRLHGARQRQAQQCGHVFAGGLAGRRRLGAGLRRRCARGDQRQRLGQLDVGGVVAGRGSRRWRPRRCRR